MPARVLDAYLGTFPRRKLTLTRENFEFTARIVEIIPVRANATMVHMEATGNCIDAALEALETQMKVKV